MNKKLIPMLIVASGAMLSGCMGGTSDPRASFRGHESPYQPVVKQNHLVLDLAAGNGNLAGGELNRARDWFDMIGLRYGDQITIDDSNGYGGNMVRNQIAGLTGRYGLIPSDSISPMTAGAVQPGMIRIVVSRATATVDGCPDWNNQSGPGVPNYGCTTNAALAQMVADPNDLVRGRSAPDTGKSSEYGIQAIEKWRKTDVKGAGSKSKAETESAGGN